MPQSTAARPGNQRKSDVGTAASEHLRHAENGSEAVAWLDGTGLVVRLVSVWKHYVERTGDQLVRFGCGLALLDVVTTLSGCFAPLLTSLLGLARFAGLIVFVPAVLRTFAIRHADQEDSELVKAIAVAVGVAALYIAVRTRVVVEMCAL